MGIAYELAKPGHEVHGLIREIMEEHHPDLVEAGVTVNAVFAYAPLRSDGVPKQPSVKLHGYPCEAVVKINSLKARVEGLADATITFDGHLWGGVETAKLEPMADDRRKALIDHELQHLELKTDGDGNNKRDDLNRPELKMRLHDVEVGWFRAIAERHGKAAGECRQAAMLVDRKGQLLWPWAPDARPTVKMTKGASAQA